jgi:hypothetical protein
LDNFFQCQLWVLYPDTLKALRKKLYVTEKRACEVSIDDLCLNGCTFNDRSYNDRVVTNVQSSTSTVR